MRPNFSQDCKIRPLVASVKSSLLSYYKSRFWQNSSKEFQLVGWLCRINQPEAPALNPSNVFSCISKQVPATFKSMPAIFIRLPAISRSKPVNLTQTSPPGHFSYALTRIFLVLITRCRFRRIGDRRLPASLNLMPRGSPDCGSFSSQQMKPPECVPTSPKSMRWKNLLLGVDHIV